MYTGYVSRTYSGTRAYDTVAKTVTSRLTFLSFHDLLSDSTLIVIGKVVYDAGSTDGSIHTHIWHTVKRKAEYCFYHRLTVCVSVCLSVCLSVQLKTIRNCCKLV